jgi:regulator of sigma E protease
MEALQSIFSLIITLGILVTIHEFGHFWVARRCGVKVLRFSVGFGKPLFSWKDRLGTEYAVAAIPLGGYVKMLDEREGPVASEDLHQAFSQKSVYQRIAIAAAGPIANFLFAIAAYWLMFVIGFSAVLPKIGSVLENSPAEKAGMQAGEIVVQVDGRDVYGWRDAIMSLVDRIGESGNIVVSAENESGQRMRYSVQVDRWLADQEQNDLIGGLGISPYRPPIPPKFSIVQPNSAAEKAGILVGDEVIAVEGEPINEWFAFVEVVQASAGKELDVTVLRDSRPTELKLVPDGVINENGVTQGKIGVGVESFKYPQELIRTVSYGPLQSLSEAVSQTWNDTWMTLGAIKKMVVGLVSLENLSGPITIARVANQSISSGFEEFLRFLAILSVSLGVLNLLPIPILDGGHILFYLVEAIRGRALSEQSQVIGFKIGLSLVVMMMVIAFYNDIMRL